MFIIKGLKKPSIGLKETFLKSVILSKNEESMRLTT